MPDIGNSLREARIRKGLSIKDVEAVTKIRTKYLEALEQGDYEILPGSTYVKAFLRSYATFLKVDGDALVEEYRRTHELRREEPGVTRVDVAQPPRSRTVAEKRKRKARRGQRGHALIGALAIVVVVLLAWLGSSWGRQDGATLSSDSISSTGSVTSVAGVSSTTTVSDPTAVSSTTASVVVTTGQNVSLVLTVTEGSCWLVVREDSNQGAELYAGTLSAGGQKTFDSSKRYWMIVGEPEVLALTVNGRPLSLEGEAGAFVVTETGVESSE
ncbi:MAG: hypothetical protein A2133_11855 [Actinobacteria bacterium RBG_16_64_13]|nr:MAG: hypothetical protein A2133_11855 [Actinobacteria bacterium RBG_16_64_13]